MTYIDPPRRERHVMTCNRSARQQHVYVDDERDLFKISEPLCVECSEDTQPAETVAVYTLEGERRYEPCQCDGDLEGTFGCESCGLDPEEDSCLIP